MTNYRKWEKFDEEKYLAECESKDVADKLQPLVSVERTKYDNEILTTLQNAEVIASKVLYLHT